MKREYQFLKEMLQPSKKSTKDIKSVNQKLHPEQKVAVTLN
jgi:hypothetical protein